MNSALTTPRGRSRSGPGTKRRSRWVAAIAALGIPLAVLAAPNAQAGTTPPFTIDGVVPGNDASADPADNPQDAHLNVKELGPLNSNTTKIGVIHNDQPPTLGFTNPNGQVDLVQAWINTKKDTPDGDDWIYFAWERDSSNGSGFIAYEFMKNKAPVVCDDYDPTDQNIIDNCNPWANRDAGDFMILWDQQGGSKDLYYREWTGTKPNLTLTPGVKLTSDVAVAEYSPDGYYGEAAINVTDVVYGGVQKCLAFANIIPSTVTGNSDTADYKDTILQPGVDLGNCGTTTTTTPQLGSGASVPAGQTITTDGVVAVKDYAAIKLTGGVATVAGTVDFTLCEANTANSAACDSGGKSVLVGDDVAVSAGSGEIWAQATSPTAYVTAAGRYCWKATYSGDTSQGISGSSDVSTGECFVIAPVQPVLSTTAGADVTLGNSVSDTASLTGTAPKPTANVIETAAPNPATRTKADGKITFTLVKNDCSTKATGTGTNPQDVTVSGDNTSYGPVTFTPDAAGTYHWKASYNGSSPNTKSATHNDTCNDPNETVEVKTVKSSMKTDQTWIPKDSATVSAPAGGALAGTVTFTLYPSSDCTGTAIETKDVTVSGASPQTVSSGNFAAQTAGGDFSWKVSYDSTNPAQEDIPDSCLEVSALSINNGGTVSSP